MTNNTDSNNILNLNNAHERTNRPPEQKILFLVDNHLIDDDSQNNDGADNDCITFTISLDEFLHCTKKHANSASQTHNFTK